MMFERDGVEHDVRERQPASFEKTVFGVSPDEEDVAGGHTVLFAVDPLDAAAVGDDDQLGEIVLVPDVGHVVFMLFRPVAADVPHGDGVAPFREKVLAVGGHGIHASFSPVS